VTDYKFALLLHLVGVLLFVAGIVLAGVAFEVGRRQEHPGEIALLLRLARVGVGLVAVGSLLLGIFGLWLVHLGHFSYRAGWVDDSIALYLVALVLGALGGQRPKRARRLAAQLHAEHAQATEQLRDLLSDRLSLAANYGSLLAILAVLVLMVFRP
jgi:uncharacterized membrane protein